jgi:hypothetical protein
VSRRKTPGTYGHATDHSWLQGIVNQFAPGCYELHYCETAADDTLGGNVHLTPDPRLASLRTGDLVSVEGDIVQGEDGLAEQTGAGVPEYRVRELWLIQH